MKETPLLFALKEQSEGRRQVPSNKRPIQSRAHGACYSNITICFGLWAFLKMARRKEVSRPSQAWRKGRHLQVTRLSNDPLKPPASVFAPM